MQLPNINASLHAHVIACSLPKTVSIISATVCPSSKPEFTPASKIAVTKPVRLGPACSLSQQSDAGISPPSAMPCTNRSTTRSTGAANPSVAYPGSNPMSRVVVAMPSTVCEKTNARPRRSAICAQRIPPNGLAKYPTAKIANVFSVAVDGAVSVGKNAAPICGAKMANMTKS